MARCFLDEIGELPAETQIASLHMFSRSVKSETSRRQPGVENAASTMFLYLFKAHLPFSIAGILKEFAAGGCVT
jgi:hypothetical protein